MNEAELIFTEILGCSRSELYLNKGMMLTRRQLGRVAGALKRRMRREPAQYILGKTEFMGMEFEVNPNVLIPRPETEVLVETAVRYALPPQAEVRHLLDIGTGSGCIAVSLRRLLYGTEVWASDISSLALETARRNADRNNTPVRFIEADLFPDCDGRVFDMIVSNPPYIREDEFPGLQPEVRWEPVNALYGGKDGLDFFYRIARGCAGHLSSSGRLLLEVGYDQSQAVCAIIAENHLRVEEVVKDYAGIDRVIVARRKNV